jgi:hypothetical protein
MGGKENQRAQGGVNWNWKGLEAIKDKRKNLAFSFSGRSEDSVRHSEPHRQILCELLFLLLLSALWNLLGSFKKSCLGGTLQTDVIALF